MVRRLLNLWEPTTCALQGGPSGRDHVVLTGSAGPKELWEMVWEHGAYVLVSLGLPDTKEKVRLVEGQIVCVTPAVQLGHGWRFWKLIEKPALVLATRHLASGDAAYCHRHGDSAQSG